MRLALYQGVSPAGDASAALAAVESTLSAAAAIGARMALFPEAFLPGYGVETLESQPLDGPWCQALRGMARQTGVGLTIGLAERDGNTAYNSALAIGPDGDTLACYRKIQLWGPRENALYAPGNDYVTFPFEGRRIGLLICYDIEFPEHTRALVRQGADLILVPTANPRPYQNVSHYAVTARAMENAVTVAYANYCGTEGAISYSGASVIAGPEGDALALAGTRPALLIADIPDPGEAMERPTEHLIDLRTIPEA